MHRLRTTRLKRPILWIAVLALLLSAIGSQLRVKTCIGECCATETMTCSVSQHDSFAKHACCDCCDETAQPGEDAPLGDDQPLGDQPLGDQPTGDQPLGDRPPGEWRDGCTPGCCVTVDFEIEMAPIDVPVELPMVLALALPPIPQSFAPMPAREVLRLRPFDRGPPRIDRSTALRVCTVLLI